MAASIEGGCQCGACRYQTSAAPINVRVCHCRKCQKAIGASFNVRVLVPTDTLAINGPVGWYASSLELRRGFCKTCGTTMFSERQANNTIGLTIGSLNNPDAFFPSDQIWASSKQAWLTLDCIATSYPESAPA